jgi:hypothetical protein
LLNALSRFDHFAIQEAPCGLSSETKISFASDGFRILDKAGGVVTLHWKEIREIVAYKEDLFGYDEICLAFRIADSEDYIRLGESCAELSRSLEAP